MTEAQPSPITTPIDYSKQNLEVLKNEVFYPALWNYLDKIYLNNPKVLASAKELAKDVIRAALFMHTRIVGNIDYANLHNSIALINSLLSIKEEDYEKPETHQTIAQNVLNYSMILNATGLDSMTLKRTEMFLTKLRIPKKPVTKSNQDIPNSHQINTKTGANE